MKRKANSTIVDATNRKRKRGRSSSNAVDQKKLTPAQHQAMMKLVDEERGRIETHYRRPSSSKSIVEAGSSMGTNRAPPLENFVSKFDLDLFRMANEVLEEDTEAEPTLKNPTTATRINRIRFGRYDIGTWYESPFPPDYKHLDKLFVCEYCLKFMRCEYQLQRHRLPGHCSLTHPPGDKIYEKGNISMWEIDGKNEKAYCQSLCLLSMLFLEHKTLFKDVEAFYFYMLTVADEKIDGTHHLVGYFSKEKFSIANRILSCILTLPPFIGRGYGQMLIDMSYLLGRIESKIGSPEHPLSDMGLKAYRGYWKSKILDWLCRLDDGDIFSVKELSQHTGIHQNDLISTLQYFGWIKHWRGHYWILRTDSVLQTHKDGKKDRTIRASVDIDPNCLTWTRVTDVKSG